LRNRFSLFWFFTLNLEITLFFIFGVCAAADFNIEDRPRPNTQHLKKIREQQHEAIHHIHVGRR
jgi:hypothetical protein